MFHRRFSYLDHTRYCIKIIH